MPKKPAKPRDYRLDNIKVFLIFCVVFGHMLELFAGDQPIYRIIYSFHMPAFLFTAGYFAKFNSKKILSNLVYPYILFQVLYSLFTGVNIQFTTPYWLLWYLFTLAIYYMLVPMVSPKHPWVAVLVSVALSLGAGFDNSVGYFLSLSRTLVFMPFFALGLAWRKSFIEKLASKIWVKGLALVGVVAACCWLVQTEILSNQMFYGSLSYQNIPGFSVGIRALLLGIALCWIVTLMWIFPKRRIPLVSVLGQNTLGIFLFHGFIQIAMRSHPEIFTYDLATNMWLAAGISLAIVIFFGNKYIGLLVRTLCTGAVVLSLLEKHSVKSEELAGAP